MTRFDNELFISYSHIDDEPLTEGQKGWVTQFHSALQAILDTRLGKHATIWRDPRLRGGIDFEKEIVAQFPKTAVMVSVVSPRYVDSKWCRREAKEFAQIARQTPVAVDSNWSRVFKVVKTPVVDEKQLPDEMQAQLGYPFYKLLDEETPLELDPSLGDEMRQEFIQKLARLAWDLSKRLRELEGTQVSPSEPPADDKPVVFLAECSYDRQEDRMMLEGELSRRGYRVLPDSPLPRDEQAHVEQVKALLPKCRLSIHLVGAGYGAVPDGPSEKSVVMLQNELAAAETERSKLKRIISLPAGLSAKQPHQQAFIDRLRSSAEAQKGADLVAGGIEAVKAAMFFTLDALRDEAANAAPKVQADEQSRGMVYVVCAQEDRKDALPLMRYLRSQHFEVKLPVFTGSAEAVSRAHEEQLATCDAVVIYYGRGDEAWRYAQQSELKKLSALRERPLACTYIYLAAPDNDDKDLILELEPNVIDGREGFAEGAVTPLTSSIPPPACELERET